MLAGREPRRMA